MYDIYNRLHIYVCTCMYIILYILYACVLVFFLQEQVQHTSQPSRPVEEWMLVCQRNSDLQPSTDSQQDVDWTQAAQSNPNVEEAPSFISQQRQAVGERVLTTSADPQYLHVPPFPPLPPSPPPLTPHLSLPSLFLPLKESSYRFMPPSSNTMKLSSPPPLWMIVSGTAGAGKSYLISLSPTSPSAPAVCCSTDWCGCLQR